MGYMTSSNSEWIKDKAEMAKNIHLMELKGYGAQEIRRAEEELARHNMRVVKG